ncbi:glycerol-3-phosphate cytidylyltransferase [Kurthia senegalensis]|uniref:glycerol-3-phosphate cytidylyltransferase n=1 Tax=Kurthia senegalensis TaxID=1033740 RepID=UPI00028A0AC1|nr:glycerol-3-phosphate cytidylyltransferase [Kurthia senegalensis]
MKKIITYGTYDMFHPGHLKLLKRAKALGDHLTVAISSDEFNQLKGKSSYYSFEDRAEIVEALTIVDEVIREDNWEQKVTDIQKLNIDTFVIGDDWEGHFDFLKEYCEVVYLKRTEGISTTKIKEDLKETTK